MGDFITYAADLSLVLSADLLRFLTDVSSGSPDTDIIDAVIGHVESEVKAYLSSKYNIPLDSVKVTPLLKNITIKMCVHELWYRTPAEIPVKVKDGFTWAENKLEQIKLDDIKTLGENTINEESKPGGLNIGGYARG